jgi:hypothetical protein
MITLYDAAFVIKSYAGRGTVREEGITVTVCVPFWKQQKIDKILESRKPLGVRLVVRPLTFWQHLTLWRVQISY